MEKRKLNPTTPVECAHCKEDPRMGDYPRPVKGVLLNTPLCGLHLKNAIIFDNRLLGVFEAYAHKNAIQTLKNHGVGAAV